MSYAVRNTLVLLLTLLLLSGAGWGYIYFYQQPVIEELESMMEERESELQGYQNTANEYGGVLAGYMESTYHIENYPVELMPDNSVTRVYDYIRQANEGVALTELNFAYQDSVANEEYGNIRFNMEGQANYRNLMNFIGRLEASRPLTKVTSLQLQSIDELEALQDVSFQMQLTSYYDRDFMEREPDMIINRDVFRLAHNPFRPLIHVMPPNEDDLVEVQESRLIGLTSRRAYLVDQNGNLVTLEPGDRVYLGRLDRINMQAEEASFALNRGGVFERVNLQMQRGEEQ